MFDPSSKSASSAAIVLHIAAIVLHIAGTGLLLAWLVETDFLFGHFKGPGWMIAAAGCLAALAALLSLLIIGGRLLDRTPRGISAQAAIRTLARKWGVGCLHLMLLVLSSLIVLIAVAEMMGI